MDIVREEEANKSVTKSVTLPNWLNKLAMEAKLNFSGILQEGLKKNSACSRMTRAPARKMSGKGAVFSGEAQYSFCTSVLCIILCTKKSTPEQPAHPEHGGESEMADYKRKNPLKDCCPPAIPGGTGTPLALFLDFLVSDDPETGSQACIDRDMKHGDFRTRSQIPSQSCIRYVAQSLYADHGKKTVTLETIREKVKNACGHVSRVLRPVL